MTGLRIGSICSGIGGLELGIEHALDATTIWQAEPDPAAATILAHHWPDNVPNLGDITTVDWTQAPPVDVMCFGFPCQDISQAGRKAGIEGDRSALWFDCAHAVRLVRPRYVLVENVSALFVRGFDVVLADLAQMGYVGRWGSLRSSDIGAPHRRERVFIAAAHAGGAGTGRDVGAVPQPATPSRRAGADVRTAVHDSATAAADPENDRQPRTRGTRHRRPRPAHSNPPPPNTTSPRRRTRDPQPGNSRTANTSGATQPRRHSATPTRIRTDPDGSDLWGRYAPAVGRWEALHRPAPAPRDNQGRLNPELAEWLLGYPAGWVTDPDIGLPRTAQLRLLGNSVQPQVSALAAQLLLAPLTALAAAS